MNDIRRTILWVIFGFSMVLLWDQWQVHNGHKATFFPTPAQQAQVAAASAAAPQAAGVPAAVVPQGTVAVPVVETRAASKELVQVETDLFKLSFDTEGGTLVRAELLKHEDEQKPGHKIVLLDDSKDRIYTAQTGLIASTPGVALPTHKTLMTVRPGARQLKDGENELSITFESTAQGGVKLVKTYTVKRGAYDMAVKHDIVNTGTQDVAPQLYFQLVRDGNKPAGESSFYSTFTGPAIYTEAKKYQKVEFADIKKKKVDVEKQASTGYIAMVQHYFASAWILPDGMNRDISIDAVDIGSTMADCCYRVTLIAPLDAIKPGQTKSVAATFYAGPQEEKKLEALYPGLELVKDYGWLTILAKPLFWLLHQLNNILGNWGWSIVSLVVLLKAAFYWLNAHAYQSMAKMKAINPKIMEMRERLKDNPQQMQVEMMKIYREEKVNPMGGCVPIALQIPVFIALYWVLLSTVEIRNAPWVGWIHDLSAPDPYFILPLFMTLTTLLQTALNPAPPDPMQAKMMWIMPLAFSVMFFFFPAGLVLYWITNNVLSIAQQWLINVRMGVPPQFNLPKF
ncbi:membrane protein insertase YidC [Limnohabitans sp. Rim8]|jgi:YidC/Oxa1 family membrane protein insertase|uniref:Membrane protein insertase YidC n=1 Tax=Limnohabitans curvus TaxID=323423 RepID=A0A315G136_9BURK|nr:MULTISPECIES: membrane protein insertase YidC [Limnohabitans]PUE57066.1 membrane protein insertase YidC [Limnohabitans sp. Rim8]PUE59397.1 membrane protein insertase YidC [Limnohabitans curvus]